MRLYSSSPSPSRPRPTWTHIVISVWNQAFETRKKLSWVIAVILEQVVHVLSHPRQVCPASNSAAFEAKPLADPLAPYDLHYGPVQPTTPHSIRTSDDPCNNMIHNVQMFGISYLGARERPWGTQEDHGFWERQLLYHLLRMEQFWMLQMLSDQTSSFHEPISNFLQR